MVSHISVNFTFDLKPFYFYRHQKANKYNYNTQENKIPCNLLLFIREKIAPSVDKALNQQFSHSEI